MTITITEDRYGGIFSRGAYTAWPCPVPEEVDDDDVTATNFWDAHRNALIGLGASPAEALANLQAKQDADAKQLQAQMQQLDAELQAVIEAWAASHKPAVLHHFRLHDGRATVNVTVDAVSYRAELLEHVQQWLDARQLRDA